MQQRDSLFRLPRSRGSEREYIWRRSNPDRLSVNDLEVRNHNVQAASMTKVHHRVVSKQYTSSASLYSPPASRERVLHVARAVVHTASPL